MSPSVVKPSADEGRERTVIAIEAVQIPGYLDRPQIVTNLNDTEYQLAEFNQWTEGLDDTLTRVIAENLLSLLSADSADVLSSAVS